MIEEKCPVCDGGPTTLEVYDRKILYRGVTRTVTLQLIHCATCGGDYADAFRAARNAAAVRDLHEQIDEELE